jgi:putative photosynthetic complex assembly protein
MNTTPVPVSPFPKAAVFAVAALLLAAIASVAAVRLSGVEIRTPDAPAVQVRALRFEDRPDGSVAVIDAHSGQLVHAVTGEAGFVRGTLRGLARERKRMGGGPEQAFELIARADGRFTLHDPVTGRRVDLDSFGPANAAGFVDILRAGQATAATGTLTSRLDNPRPQ